jgi:hypothetical protein
VINTTGRVSSFIFPLLFSLYLSFQANQRPNAHLTRHLVPGSGPKSNRFAMIKRSGICPHAGISVKILPCPKISSPSPPSQCLDFMRSSQKELLFLHPLAFGVLTGVGWFWSA